MTAGALGVVLLGGALAFDRNATPSLFWSQPLVAGALAGALLGHFESGVAAGALMQMIYAAGLPVGGALLPDSTLAGLTAALCVPADVRLAGAAWLDDPRLAAPAALGVVAAVLGRWALVGQRRWQGHLVAVLPEAVERGDWRRIERLHRTGAWLHVVRGVSCTALVAVAAPPLALWLARAGLAAPVGRIALALGGLALMRAAGGRRRLLWIGVGALLGLAAAFV